MTKQLPMMSNKLVHREAHLVHRIGWLRAAVLGANDGIISTASLMVGVATAAAQHSDVMLAGIAGLTAGAMSMAAGEYVSVRSQADAENADLARESRELSNNVEAEREELAQIYVVRGVDVTLAREVSRQLMAKDALGAHAREELGISEISAARPIQAAIASAASFAAGGIVPVLIAVFAQGAWLSHLISGGSILLLMGLGALGARVGGADVLSGAARVAFWGAAAMAVTAAIGAIIGPTL